MNKISDYKNKYLGKRCFVVGNGPSIKKTNLDNLVGEYSFAMNRISMIYKRTKWRPTFFVCTTTNIKREGWQKDILNTIRMENTTSFVWRDLKEHTQSFKNINYISCSHGREVTNSPELSWWSNDISKRVCKFGTSMLVCLQIATYMGFNPIYIIGADLGFKKEPFISRFIKILTKNKVQLTIDQNHFDKKYGTPGLLPHDLNSNMLAAHKLCRRSTRRIGVDVLNATCGGELEVYPRVRYDKLFL